MDPFSIPSKTHPTTAFHVFEPHHSDSLTTAVYRVLDPRHSESHKEEDKRKIVKLFTDRMTSPFHNTGAHSGMLRAELEKQLAFYLFYEAKLLKARKHLRFDQTNRRFDTLKEQYHLRVARNPIKRGADFLDFILELMNLETRVYKLTKRHLTASENLYHKMSALYRNMIEMGAKCYVVETNPESMPYIHIMGTFFLNERSRMALSILSGDPNSLTSDTTNIYLCKVLPKKRIDRMLKSSTPEIQKIAQFLTFSKQNKWSAGKGDPYYQTKVEWWKLIFPEILNACNAFDERDKEAVALSAKENILSSFEILALVAPDLFKFMLSHVNFFIERDEKLTKMGCYVASGNLYQVLYSRDLMNLTRETCRNSIIAKRKSFVLIKKQAIKIFNQMHPIGEFVKSDTVDFVLIDFLSKLFTSQLPFAGPTRSLMPLTSENTPTVNKRVTFRKDVAGDKKRELRPTAAAASPAAPPAPVSPVATTKFATRKVSTQAFKSTEFKGTSPAKRGERLEERSWAAAATAPAAPPEVHSPLSALDSDWSVVKGFHYHRRVNRWSLLKRKHGELIPFPGYEGIRGKAADRIYLKHYLPRGIDELIFDPNFCLHHAAKETDNGREQFHLIAAMIHGSDKPIFGIISYSIIRTGHKKICIHRYFSDQPIESVVKHENRKVLLERLSETINKELEDDAEFFSDKKDTAVEKHEIEVEAAVALGDEAVEVDSILDFRSFSDPNYKTKIIVFPHTLSD